MNSNHRITSQARRWGAGIGIAVGAGVAVAMVGMTSAPGAHADPVDAASTSSTDPIGLLDSAASDLTQASDVLGKAEVPGSLQQFLDLQTQAADLSSHVVSQAESIQDPLLSSDNSSVSSLANLFFGDIDEQFAQDSAALLAADQAFAADPSQATEFGLFIPDFQLVGANFDLLFSDFAGVFADELLGLLIGGFGAATAAGSDAAASAGADLAAGLSPDLFF